MLMFVFGAGASYDSDPARRPGDPDLFESDVEHRPPLAAGLFDPASAQGQEAIGVFPRAAPLIMQLRQATAQGLDVEEVLEQIATDDGFPNTEVQLLAFRAYLTKLLTAVPHDWLEECQGLTNYVLALEKAHRWNVAVHPAGREPISCVTFNYDVLLEDAVERVFGHPLNDIDTYTTSPEAHVFKPHGSVTWQVPAAWDHPANSWVGGRQGLDLAINRAAALRWDDTDLFRYTTVEDYQDSSDATTVWLPALSIPVRFKSNFNMPKVHMDKLVSDLGQVTTLVAVGWRGRENHFLRLLQDHMPSAPGRLVVVSGRDDEALDTVNGLWETGRFSSYAISGVGFSGFVETPTEAFPRVFGERDHSPLTLDHVLTARDDAGVWTTRVPGAGLPEGQQVTPFFDRGYVDL